jgi:CHAT domain-containing protein
MLKQLQTSSRRKLLKPLCCALSLIANLITVSTILAIDGPAISQQRLEPGKPVVRALAASETHGYQIDLGEGQFLYVIVEQYSVDVAVTLLAPDGKQIVEVNAPYSMHIPESIWHVSEVAGAYKVLVRSMETEAGEYQIRIEEQRAAATQDRYRADGQKVLLRGAQLLEEKTEESAKQAAEKFQSALDLWRQSGDPAGEADALASIGLFYSSIDDREKALEYYNRALELVRALNNRRQEAYVLYLMGQENITSTVENKRKAVADYQQSLALMREVGDRWGETRVLDALGLVYHSLTEPQKAFEYFIPLLSLQRSLGDRIGAANTLIYMGELQYILGDNQKALDHYNEALSLTRAVAYVDGELYTLRNIGIAYTALGEYDRALSHLEQVNSLNQNDPHAHATTLGDIGGVYAKLGDHQKALGYYNQALPIWQKLKSRRFEGYTLSQIGSVHRDLGNYQKALDFFNQALPHSRHVGDRRSEAATVMNIGKVELLLGDTRKSLESYSQALALSQAVGAQNLEAQALDGMANAQSRLGNLVEARRLSEGALKIIEAERAKIVTRELRATYYASVQQYYDTYIDLLMRLHQTRAGEGYDAMALEASERARARSLLESLNEARVDIRAGVDPELLERERTLQRQLQSKAEFHMRLLSSKPTEEQIAVSKKETEALLAAYHEVEGQIRIRSPHYAALTQPTPFSLKEIQHQLLDADTLLLEYRLGEEGSFLWAVTNNSLKSFDLPKRTEVEAAARRVYDLLTARNRRVKFETATERETRIARADADFFIAANTLSEMILAPAAELLGKNRLLIVSDGALHYIPFAALPSPLARLTGDNESSASIAGFHPLIVNHEVVNLPSALSLATLRREITGRKPAAKTLAIFADPVFDKDDARVKAIRLVRRASMTSAVSQVTDSTRSLPPDLLRSVRASTIGDEPVRIQRLPFTRREAKQIAALIPQSDRKEALDFAASRSTATSAELSSYRYIHFATHGFLNSAHPELSGIVLSLVDENGVDQDGFLRSFEIFNLKLPAEMIVLSGCRTGLGKEIKGEGLVGMTRGFMYAGAARVLVSLWDIPDEASAELMSQIYREMLSKERLRPAAALRAAQSRIWKEKHWQAPYYWAAFVLQGEPR